MLRKRLRSSAGGRYSRRRRGEALVLYSKRRASAFRLDLWPVRTPLTVVSAACFRRFASEPFAGLLRFIAAAPPTRQHTTAMLTLTYR